MNYSMSPNGEKFELPGEAEYGPEFARVQELASAARADGNEIVVVVGVGFVGAVMAAIIADTTDDAGTPSKFVIEEPLADHGTPYFCTASPE